MRFCNHFSIFKVVLSTILPRFEYDICINNFSVGKCLSDSSRYMVNNKKPTALDYIWKNLSQSKMSSLWQLLIEMLGLFFEPT